ncbi:MAG: ribonuclease HII, partial [Methylocystis sp.]|nr:ribonuclease HII [Methylocystis sp.]
VEALSSPPAFVWVDGNDPPPLACPCRAVVRGDARVMSIAAASIVAKVARDAMMRRLAEAYPQYGFDRNAGYATQGHRRALAAMGPTPLHRFSFAPLRKR